MLSSKTRTASLPRIAFVVLISVLPTVFAKYTPFIPLSFLFAWTPQGQSPPIPVTEQCQYINITWGRQAATGPSPVAPYYLQIYTSAYTYPFVIPVGDGLSFMWQVPFSPGTLYQICMFDSLGNTGGCQATYTVIAPRASTTTPTCTNVTTPNGPLNVIGQVVNGVLSQFDSIPQCTDIAVTPQNGTPPYTFTIAPSLHPPYNITSNSSTINWTISLSWATPFFISVVDSRGNAWASGPLHSDNGPNVECLGLSSDISPKKPFPAVTVGGAIGSAVGGLILGLILSLFFQRCRQVKTDTDSEDHSHQLPADANLSLQYRPTSDADVGGPQYHIEPFTMPSMPSEDQRSTRTVNRVTSMTSTDIPLSPTNFSESDSQAGPSRVYVVHHDSGQMPVTVYTSGGTVVTELPPGYPGHSRSGESAAGPNPRPSDDLPPGLSQRRQPGPSPQKGAASDSYND